MILSIFSKKLTISPLIDDVPLDGIRFGDFVLSISEVWKIGEVKAKIDLVIFEPVISRSVFVVLKFDSCNMKKQSVDMSKPSDSPITKFNLGSCWLNCSHWG